MVDPSRPSQRRQPDTPQPVEPPPPGTIPAGGTLTPQALRAPDLGTDVAFAATLDDATRVFGAPLPPPVVCGWCNAALDDPAVARCPHCDAPLRPVDDELVVPGVTDLAPEARLAAQRLEDARLRAAARGPAASAAPRPRPPGAGEVDVAALARALPALAEAEVEAAVRPPDPEVRRLMRQLEQEALAARARDVKPPPELAEPPGETNN